MRKKHDQKIHTILTALFLLFSFCCSSWAAEQVYFYHTDPAGTPLAMTNASGTVVWKADYKPFGEENSLTASTANNKRFVGKEKDAETGFSYFGARYEDARTGRFAAVDPVRAVDPKSNKTNEKILSNPQRLNAYAYGLNNPYRYIDPDGMEPWNVSDLAKIESVMSKWESAETPYATKGTKYAGSSAEKGKGADCSGSMYATIKEAGFDIKYFTTAMLKQAGKNDNVDSYFKTRENNIPQRGDLVLFNGHVVYYLGQNSEGSHNVYGAHYTGGPDFDKHTYSDKSFNPVKVLYYDNK